MNKSNHIHRYKKENIAARGKEEFLVYKCTKPLCSHYIPIKLAEGKLCECNRCGETMIITRSVLVHSGGKPMSRPHCINCIKRRKSHEVEAISEFLDGVKTQV